MAEFKLGRIKFVYQGNWAPSTGYVVDDVVSVGGKTYICTVTNTSSSLFATDLASSYWNLMADGTSWKGSWANSTYYQLGDQVQYGGLVYVCTTAHTSASSTATLTATGFSVSAGTATLTYATQSVQPFLVGATITLAGFSPTQTSGSVNNVNTTFTVVTCTPTQVTFVLTGTYTVVTLGTVAGSSQLGLEANQSSWSAFAQNFSWQNSWTANNRYKVNDLVSYDGYTYLCNTAHVSASTTALGLENDQNKWSTFNAGVYYAGAWASSTRYKLNDIVVYGATVWICTTQHTSTSTFDNIKFSVFVGGIEYKSSWSIASTYVIGDIVTYGGNAYIATTNNTAQIPSVSGSSYWSVFTTGFNYQGDWSNATSYKVGSVVRLNGYTYIATADNAVQTIGISSTTVSTDPSRPNQITLSSLSVTGATGTGTTATLTFSTQSSAPYAIGQTIVVSGVTTSAGVGTYNGTFIVTACNTTSVSYLTTTTATYSTGGTISASTNLLAVGLPISFTGTAFGGLSNTQPYFVNTISDSTHFTVTTTQYSGTAVTLTTATGSMTGTTNPTPPYATYWTRLNPGVYWNPTNASYSAVSGTNISSVGTGATFDITTKNTVYTVTIHSGAAGSNYQTNDTIKILGTNVGGISPANDITLTVTASGGAITTVVATGIAVTWVTGTAYVLGDVVMYGASSYICVLAHTAASANTPAADTTATYWNLLASGTEQAVLTTTGDMFYYGANGPTRLPIGTDGQILRVNNNAPAWSYYGTINNLVYVGPTGADVIGNGQGLTLDKPWKTIRYACLQVENGYLNTNATSLLAKNKQFLLKETNNYVQYNYSYNIASSSSSTNAFTLGTGTYQTTTSTMYVGMPISFTGTVGGVTASTTYYVYTIPSSTTFTITATQGGNVAVGLSTVTGTMTGSYVYSASKTERDSGYVLDAVIFDLGHAGTQKTTAAALAYVTSSGLASGVNSYDVTPFYTSLNYLGGTLIKSVVSNTAPTQIYQTLNGVSSGSQAKQIIDTTLTAESGVATTASTLVGIVSSAIYNGSSAQIPTVINPNTTISVKTGTYNETLPIVVPANTAITGDELRSTVVQPRSADLNLANDKLKSIDALIHTKGLLSNIISNTVITATAGNAQVISVTGVVGTGATVTLTFATQSSLPFAVGQYITVSGFSGGATGYNGSQVVTVVTNSTVSYANTTTAASAGTPIVSSQVTGLTAGDTGSTTAVQSVVNSAALIQNILNNGLSQVPSFSFTQPTGYNSTYLVTYGNAVTQIVNNYNFIKAEIVNYLNDGSYGWGSYSAAYQAETQRDTGYILDALQYDLTYGGNTASLIIGRRYYSLGINQIVSPYLTGTLAALARLKVIIGQIVQGTAVSASAGNTVTQYAVSPFGNSTAATAAQGLVQNIIDWINQGYDDTATPPTASIALASSSLQTAYNAIVAKSTEIQNDAQAWVTKFFQNQNISTTLTNRDAGYIVNALALDMVLGSNFMSILAGRSFWANVSSAQTLIATELAATTGAINFIGYKTKQIAASGSVAAASTSIDDMISYIYGQISFNTVTTGVVGGTQTIAYSASDVITVSNAGQTATFTPTLTTATSNLSITNITTGGVATFSSTVTVIKGQSVVVTGATGGMSAGTYYVTSGASSTTAVTLSSSYNNAVSGTPASFTGGGVTGSTVVIGSLYNTVANVTVASGGTWTNTPINAQTTTVSVSSGTGLTITLNFGASSYSTTVSAVTTSTNVITVGTTASMAVGMPIKFANLPTPITTTATATTTSTNIITLAATAASLGIVAGQIIYFTGTTANGLYNTTGNIVPYTNYYVINPSGSTIQISATSGGSAIALTTSSTTMNVYVNAAGGLVSGNTYWINTIPSTTSLTVANSFANVGLTVYPITTTVGSMSATATAGATPQTTGTVTYNNTLSTIQGVEILRANSNFLAYESSAYIANKYTGTISNTNSTGNIIQTTGAHNLTVGDPVVFTATTVNTTATATTVSTDGTRPNQITVGTTTGMVTGMPIQFTGTGFGGLSSGGVIYYIKTIPDGTHITVTPYQTVSTTATSTTTGTNLITLGSVYGLSTQQPIVFTGTSANGITNGTTYYVLSINTSTNQITICATPGGSTPVTITASGSVSFTVAASNATLALTTATGSLTATAGGLFGGVSANTVYYVLTTPTTSQLTVSAIQLGQGTQTALTLTNAWGVATVSYYFVSSYCVRDTNSFISALIYDLQYPGNYKSLRAAQLYINAVTGSQTQNMFLVRNGTGLRNMTMNGLTGYLSAPNQYGTKRPTAGAYASLDPGFGPNDTNVWIISRSCYTQNCTMFGYACVGAKVDGSLHAGGNRSMVANDYTTIMGDGIGYWVTGSNALAELVSVFNYYGFAGYVAEYGGKIRATNGNSSYGTYGVIAEGTDTFETAINGTVNNRYFAANITNVNTDGINNVLNFEYENAGSGYTNSVATISGSGYNATATHDEFRDASVFETRLTDNGDGSSTSVGGTSYVTATNTSQGTASSGLGTITTAATDTALSTAYVGMRVQITAGTGAGQYANILTYSNGSKIAQIVKNSFSTLTVTATTAGGNNLLTVASTGTLYVGMPIYLDTTFGGLTAYTLYYVIAANFSATQFAVSTSFGGSAVTTTATSAQTVNLYAAGWDHVIPGYTIANTLDLSTTYLIEPRIQYTAPGYTATGRTMSTTAQWQSMTYGAGYFVAIANGSTSSSFSVDGKSWSSGGALSANTMVDVVYGGGQGATATAILGGFGGSGASLTAVLGSGLTAGQVVNVTINNGGTGYSTPPNIVFVSSTGIGATATCTVLNGSITSVTITIPGSGYATAPTVIAATGVVSSLTANSWGKNYYNTPTVTIAAPFTATTWSSGGSVTSGTYYSYVNTATTPNTTNYYLANASGTFSATPPIFQLSVGTGSAGTYGVSLTYVGTLALATATVTNYGASSYVLTNNGYGYTSVPAVTVIDSSAKFVAISGTTAVVNYSTVANLSSSWTSPNSGNALPASSWTSVAYGGGVFVAVGSTANAASSGDGVTWISRAIPSLGSGSYSCVTYGNGYFVALQTGGTSYATSPNGVTWTAGTNALPANTTWSSIAYGNGRFVALAATGAIAVCYNVQLGAGSMTWTSVPTATGASTSILSSSYTWTTIRYGQGLFVAIAQGTVSATSPDGIVWTLRTMPGSSTNWKALSFGNPTSTTLGSQPIWAAASNTSSNTAASIRTGATPLGRITVKSGAITEVRLVEPGSGFPKGNVTATTVTTNLFTVDDTTNLSTTTNTQPIVFNQTVGNIISGTTYYVIGSSVTGTQFQVSATSGSSTAVTLITSSPTGMTYRASPVVTQTDPNKVKTAILTVRTGDGALGNPSFSNRGTNNTTATATTLGDGYSDLYQNTAYINISGLYAVPTAGANVQFGTNYTGQVWTANTSVYAGATLIATNIVTSSGTTVYYYNVYTVATSGTTGTTAPTFTSGTASDGTATLTYVGQNPNTWYKLVATTNVLGVPGNYTMQFQINPSLTTANAPVHGTAVTTRLKFSQVRLTGHDFLYIGTGNQTQTNYPYVNVTTAIQANQTNSNGGGRVFYTSTDQDGNFNVGGYFGVQQSTGTATLNASAFNLAGLQSLTLGSVSLGVGSATITQFSTDPYFTANSDSVVPTQKAIKSYITAQIGGGSSSLNVNTLTAGVIYIAGNTISTTNSGQINVSAKMNFTGGIDGSPVALGFFMQR
jgi:hypothetical protein